jgi:hypothetical protein
MSSIEKQHEDWDYQQLLEERQKLADEIERLRAALLDIARLPYSQERDNTAQDLAKEALENE